jgi:hypothetical protein
MKHGRIFLTKHAIGRFRERFGQLYVKGIDPSVQIYRLIDQSTDNRSFLNNTAFLTYCRERYGCDQRYKFLVKDNIVFVVNCYKGEQRVVTILNKDMTPYIQTIKKFKKQPAKNEVPHYEEPTMDALESVDSFLDDFTSAKKKRPNSIYF